MFVTQKFLNSEFQKFEVSSASARPKRGEHERKKISQILRSEGDLDKYLGNMGLAPKVISSDADFLVTEYISGRTLSESDILESHEMRVRTSEL
ncbi:unnamed protein product [Bathycoccus prasinos]